jgi:glycosyltransferase involved in cell wall biosynthesis
MADPILWIYAPEYGLVVDHIPHSGLVWDLADDLAAYHRKPSRYHYIARCIDRLASLADFMVVTSPVLLEKFRRKTRKCVLIPNGFDEKLFDGLPRPMPGDLKSIPRPLVGFVGVLFGFLDYDLLYELARSMPEVSLVFVGPVEKSGRPGVQRLGTLANVHFLGSKPRQEIPAYLSNFDICINPFKVDAVSRAVSPLKVYEYLACGKPVVSTPMEGLAREEAGRWVRFAHRPGFGAAVRQALEELPPGGINGLEIQAAQAFSWTSQFNKLAPHLKGLLSISTES